MAQSVECHKDIHSSLGNHVTKLNIVVFVCNPRDGEVERRVTGQPSLLGEFQAIERLSPKQRSFKLLSGCPLTLTYVHTHMSAQHTHTPD